MRLEPPEPEAVRLLAVPERRRPVRARRRSSPRTGRRSDRGRPRWNARISSSELSKAARHAPLVDLGEGEPVPRRSRAAAAGDPGSELLEPVADRDEEPESASIRWSRIVRSGHSPSRGGDVDDASARSATDQSSRHATRYRPRIRSAPSRRRRRLGATRGDLDRRVADLLGRPQDPEPDALLVVGLPGPERLERAIVDAAQASVERLDRARERRERRTPVAAGPLIRRERAPAARRPPRTRGARPCRCAPTAGRGRAGRSGRRRRSGDRSGGAGRARR